MAETAQDLEEVLNALEEAANGNGARISVGEIVEAFGKRSFGPLLLLGGLLGMTPVAAIPTAPTVIAIITLLISAQLLFGRESIWIPGFLEKLSVKSERMQKAVRVGRKPARLVDRLVRPRLQALTRPAADRLVALACVLLALAVPPLELLPFVAFIPAAAIATFGLGLIARDGLVVLIAFLVSAGAFGLIGWQLLAR